jgi:hypothetical protein
MLKRRSEYDLKWVEGLLLYRFCVQCEEDIGDADRTFGRRGGIINRREAWKEEIVSP